MEKYILQVAIVVGCLCVVSGLLTTPPKSGHAPKIPRMGDGMSMCDPNREMNEDFSKREARAKMTGRERAMSEAMHFNDRVSTIMGCGSTSGTYGISVGKAKVS